jgi:hypothetical protein
MGPIRADFGGSPANIGGDRTNCEQRHLISARF